MKLFSGDKKPDDKKDKKEEKKDIKKTNDIKQKLQELQLYLNKIFLQKFQ